MISVDTNVIVRFLTGDDQLQFEKAKTLLLLTGIKMEWILLTPSIWHNQKTQRHS